MDTFPLESDEIPEGYTGWLIFFDELTSALPAVQAASYKIILDRMVGQHKLNHNVVIAAAGNTLEDNAIVHEMSTALQSRLIHINMVSDVDIWLNDFAIPHDFDHRITSFIKNDPDMLYSFNPDHDDQTYPCNRTWEFMNKLFKDREITYNDVPLAAGTIGEGAARTFIGFCQIYKDLITIEDILRNPMIHIPEEKSVLFALTGVIANRTTLENIDKLMQFVNRLPIEFQIITLREMIARNKKITQSNAVSQWIHDNENKLF